jgi:hypothetical protein
MTDEKKKEPEQETPAHSTEQERERLKDFNKDGIPPGSSCPRKTPWKWR